MKILTLMSLKASKTAKTLNSNHNDIQLKDYDVKESILKMNDIYSEPFGDTSQIPTYLYLNIPLIL